MGVFSSKTVHYVGTQVTRLVDDDQIVNPYSLAIAEATFSKVDLVDNLLETSLNTTALKANLYYNFVQKNYPHKMPSGQVFMDTRFSEAVEAKIQALNPLASLSFSYSKFGPSNAFHEAWEKLVSEYGYDSVTGSIASKTKEGEETRLMSVRIELPYAMQGKVTQWETTSWTDQDQGTFLGYYTAFDYLTPAFKTGKLLYANRAVPTAIVSYLSKVADKPRLSFGIRDSYSYETNAPDQEEFEFPLTKFHDENQYFQSLFKIGGVPTFWSYQYGSGLYPELDGIENTVDAAAAITNFYPNTYYRLNKQPVTDPVYAKMAKRLGVDFNDLSEGIHQNDDIGSVDSAIFTFGIPADSSNQMELKYLFDFFKQIYMKNRNGVWRGDDYLSSWLTNYKGEALRTYNNAIVVRDDVFKYALVYNRITRTITAGNIGPVGFASMTTGASELPVTGPPPEPDRLGFVRYESPKITTYRAYRKQVSSTMWEEIRVYNLSMVYDVIGDMKTTLGDEDAEICLVPLDRSLVKKMSAPHQQELITRSFNFVFNSHVVQKVKWYQRGFFKALMVIAAIAIFIYTGFEAFSALQAAFAAGGMIAVAQLVAYQVIVSVAVNVALKVFIKAVGIELAFIAAIVAAAMGVYGKGFASLNAKELLGLGSQLANSITGYIKEQFEDLQAEMNSFLSLKSEAEKELERATELLDPGITPFAKIIVGETPEQFLYRSTVFLSSGFTELNDASQYVDRALYLPKSDYTLTI